MDRLANDNAVGRIFIEGQDGAAEGELLAFPGRDRPKAQSYGPFSQEGTLDGILIAVGGQNEAVPLRLQDGEDDPRQLRYYPARSRGSWASTCFEPIRITGTGRWTREIDGTWTLHRFRVLRFELLSKGSLRDNVDALRAISGNSWHYLKSPLYELAALRHDEDGQN